MEQWRELIDRERQKKYFQALEHALEAERRAGKVLYPPSDLLFRALELTPLERVSVVILGQDPYHGPGQAQGLAFSVPQGVALPPSLRNIFRELQRDLGVSQPAHGCLETWAAQGVLLLNTVLTVRAGEARSHRGLGWEHFTDALVRLLVERRSGLVFLLWGAEAQAKRSLIDETRHRVLSAPHPSPLSAHRGFLGCSHFSAANELLRARGTPPIDWALPPN